MKRPACFAALCLSLFLFLMLQARPPDLHRYDGLSGKTVKARGIVSDKYLKNGSFCLNLSGARFDRGKGSEKQKYDIIAKLSQDQYLYDDLPPVGCTVLVRGRVYVFDTARNPGQFDMALYEKCRGIDLLLTSCEILEISGRPDRLMEELSLFEDRVSSVYDRLFPKEYAGIIKAMTLGDKSAVDQEIKASYTRAGIAHILCISGLHISLIGCFVYITLKKLHLPRMPSAAASLILLMLYAAMTGMGIGAKRALIMFFLMLAADFLGRSYDLLSALAVSGCIILLGNPYSLYDSGFIMSFGAITGIGVLKPAFDRVFPMKGKIADTMKLSAAVTVFTFPVILYFYFQIPLYSVFLNLFTVPLMGILLISAFIAGIAGLLFLPAGLIPAKLCSLILGIYEGVCGLNDKLPYSVLVKGRPGIVYIITYYLMLILSVILIERYAGSRKDPVSSAKMILLGLFLCLAVLIIPVNINHKTCVTMLDIGQGDCTCIETQKGHVIMIDCGSSDEKEIAKYKVIPFLKSRGRAVIDTAVMTHADNDHISGFTELFTIPEKESLPVKNLILPDTAVKDESYVSLMELAEKRGTRVRFIKTKDVFAMDGITFECLHPDSGYECADRNEYSTVLALRYGSFDALFTGDIEGRGEEILTKRVTDEYTLLKCAHHGSDNSTNEEFLLKVSPDVTFISAGRGNSYGHPGKELLRRLENAGSRIFVTKDKGALMLSTDGKSVRVRTYLK